MKKLTGVKTTIVICKVVIRVEWVLCPSDGDVERVDEDEDLILPQNPAGDGNQG